MQPRRLGNTTLMVTPLGLGLAALGRPGYMTLGHAADLECDYAVDAMRDRAAALLDAAWAAGVRYVDAARSYGRAEAFLAAWLAARGHAPAALTIGSKWGYTYTAEWRVNAAHHEVKDHTLATLERQLAETRACLGAHLGLYQIHSATIESGVLDDAAVLARLAALRAEGVAIGLSLTGPRQAETLQRALAVRVDGVRLFDAVQATWNLLEPSAGAALATAHAAGVGVIVKEALANGRLTARNADPTFAATRARLASMAARLACSLDALALAAALAQPWADVVLSGAAALPVLTSNLTALRVPWSPQLAAELAPLAEPAQRYWATRAAMPWT